jgi:hypothetical protein
VDFYCAKFLIFEEGTICIILHARGIMAQNEDFDHEFFNFDMEDGESE